MRTRFCGQVSKADVGKELTVCGWVRRVRKLGGLTFVDVADKTGLLQLSLAKGGAESLTRESVIRAKGVLVDRKSPNPDLPTGLWEVKVERLEVLSAAAVPPMLVEDPTDALEEVRLRHRYLDIRRPSVIKTLELRAKLISTLRSAFEKAGFLEVETPYLTTIARDGAKGFIVPTRHVGRAYALAQSPQLYKQLLMVAGVEKYFQIARCFRDEDQRADRQPEFTQLDMEMSFVSEADVMAVTEKAVRESFGALGFNLPGRFPVIAHSRALDLYGSDKPDLRFGLSFVDATKLFGDSAVRFLAKGPHVRALVLPRHLTREEGAALERAAKDAGGAVSWVNAKSRTMAGGPLAKLVEPQKIDFLLKQDAGCGSDLAGCVVVAAGELANVQKALGAARLAAGDALGLRDPQAMSVTWVVDWPLFEIHPEEKRVAAAHHPFTSPTEACLSDFDKSPEKALARAYDLVLNGAEVGGGSIRIHDPAVQQRMFRAIGMTEAEVKDEFGYLLEAFSYGVPPHGGIALGLDRIVAILAGVQSIRDVIAFPKNSAGVDLMTNAPVPVRSEALAELGLKQESPKAKP